MFFTKTIILNTKKSFEIIDLTDQLKKFVKKNNLTNGLVNVYTTHTTTSIKINEAEDGFFKDLENWFTQKVPTDVKYWHNDLEVRDPKTMCESREECLNGHSHVRQMLLGASSETIPLISGKLSLGQWQRVLFFELDHARERKVIFSFVGEKNK